MAHFGHTTPHRRQTAFGGTADILGDNQDRLLLVLEQIQSYRDH